MSPHAAPQRSLSDQVFERLTGDILAGRVAPGEALPSERKLSESLRVNRHVVREALRRLEQIGLVHVAQRGATRVLDWERHAGLDLLPLLADHAGDDEEARRFWLSIAEQRAIVGADAARLCAMRADHAVRQDLLRISDAMRHAPDDETLYRYESEFWRRVLDGVGNVVYRLALNSMLKAENHLGTAAHTWLAEESRRSDFRRPIAEAIAAGDAEAAERLTRDAVRGSRASCERPLQHAQPVQAHS